MDFLQPSQALMSRFDQSKLFLTTVLAQTVSAVSSRLEGADMNRERLPRWIEVSLMLWLITSFSLFLWFRIVKSTLFTYMIN